MSDIKVGQTGQLQPPQHLSEKAAALWRHVVPARARSAGRLAMLTVALEAFDRCEQFRERVQLEGLTSKTKTTGAIHIHPLLKAEKEARQQFLTAWTALSLNYDQQIDGVSLDTWQRAQDKAAAKT